VRIRVEVDDDALSVEGEDVLAWVGRRPADDRSAAALARQHAHDYVRDNPRPEPDAQGAINVPARQRMALLRRLAAGPATRVELLAAMRGAAGYVGAHDWRNRLDELRGNGKRGGGHTPLPIEQDEDTYRLTEPFPEVRHDVRDRLALLKAVARELDPEAARLLEGLLPGLPVAPRTEVRDAIAALQAQAVRRGDA